MDTLGVINGIIDEQIQAPYYPEFAVNNTYGIKAVNDTVYTFMKNAYYMPEGCHDQIEYCKQSDRTTEDGYLTCAEATNLCRSLVEEPYYAFGGRGVYDIRHPYDDPTPPDYFEYFLNLASTQEAIGVNINYTSTNAANVSRGFASTGDFVFPNFLEDLEEILGYGVRVALLYGDADYICNWFGGEAVSLAVNYTTPRLSAPLVTPLSSSTALNTERFASTATSRLPGSTRPATKCHTINQWLAWSTSSVCWIMLLLQTVARLSRMTTAPTARRRLLTLSPLFHCRLPAHPVL
jgi:carboxypeptidase C (cathepsin A)